MAKCFSKRYRNHVNISVSARCYIPATVPQEQSAKTILMGRIQRKEYLLLYTVEVGAANMHI